MRSHGQRIACCVAGRPSGGWFASVLAATLCLIAVVASGASVDVGYDGGAVARIPVGAGSAGMGPAYTAIAHGADSGFWNPAALCDVEDVSVGGAHTGWLGAGIRHQYLAVGAPLLSIPSKMPDAAAGRRSVGAAFTWVSATIPNIPWWEDDRRQGVFSAGTDLLLVSWGVRLQQWPGVSFGVSVKGYTERILEGTSLGLGFDAGLLWVAKLAGLTLRLAAVGRDLGDTRIRWRGTGDEPVARVPWTQSLAASVDLLRGGLSVAVGYERGVERSGLGSVGAGVALRFSWLRLRLAAHWRERDAAPLLGVGASLAPTERWSVHYAYMPAKIGSSHLVSFDLELP